ncbi:DNA/RNA helicase domain-containing protein [Vibrio sp. BS-M-Sm-2]|uniref:DNA/RNA helicase domain-containing protein n=1 Tax=Vibrio sp. BS-M-Sm-2 TaxID=3241167 RepID=UPI003555CC64
MTYCYANRIDVFLQEQEENWLANMCSEFGENFPGLELGELQKRAWVDCFRHLQKELSKRAQSDGYIIFEYALPMEGGRRPDVLLLVENKLFILEFKMKDRYQRADYDQLCGYYRDLCNYHHESAELEVIAGLVLTQSTGKLTDIESNISILSSDKLKAFLDKYLTGAPTNTDLKQWLESPYAPLPNLVDAAVEIFQNNPIEELKSAKSAGIYEALDELDKVTAWVESEGNRNRASVLTLVTGVPGAGKTLLGLEFVHRNKRGQFLSGNGPLVDVLQYALDDKTFVRALKDFKREYMKPRTTPHTNLVVFDEAQRMWDENKNKNYQMSEPSCIIRIADKDKDKDKTPCHYVALVGEGQEIYVGEEVGISLWCDALKSSEEPWIVFCPPALEHHFQFMSSNRVRVNPLLNLDQSLRAHSASLYPKWVEGVLNDKPDVALAKQTIKDGFNIYLTRDLEKAKRYCLNRYQNTNKKYGLLSSSDNIKYNKQPLGPWFHDDVSSSTSCCSFQRTISEFDCQGLELDMPVLIWAKDFLYNGSGWVLHKGNRNVQNPFQIKLNSYRVLMTRGRDGVVFYFPQEALFDETYEYFLSAGAQCL